MKVINKEGKLFGKVNIIDLTIVVFLLAVLVLSAIKITEDKGPTFIAEKVDVELDIILRSMYDGFQNDLNIGDKLYDSTSGAYIGIITDKQVTPAIREVTTNDGRVVRAEVPQRWDIIFTVKGQGIDNADKGVTLGGEIRQIGLYFQMETHQFIVSGAIVDLRIDGE